MMDYDAIAAYFLTPSETTPEPGPLPTTPARRLRDAIEPIATIGWWSRAAADRFMELGHGFFDGYVWGRAASLGADVVPAVIVAAFGVFEPKMLTGAYQHGRGISAHESILTARAAGASAGLGAATAGVDPQVIESFGTPLLVALEKLDGIGRPLFGALRSLPTPDDPYGRAWRAAELVREHRGDGHIASIVGAGLDMAQANVLTEVWLGYPLGEYSATRGFSPDQIGAAADELRNRGWLTDDGTLTRSGQAGRDALEAATDMSQRTLIAALGENLDDVVHNATIIAESILRSQAAPADPRKRAAG